ncbi:MAG: class I SAM-dependent methyltransferase [Chloroflexota bacterium]|nr:class I SAM-dependent methyltransferase [Chloroflexota bacterium]
MSPLDWMDVSEVSFNAMLLLERIQIEYIATLEPDAQMGTALKANPAVDWYLRQMHEPCGAYIDRCLEMAQEDPAPEDVRKAEVSVLNRFQDWLVYALDPEEYDRQPFLSWDDASLLGMADYKDKIVIDIGAGTGRLAFLVAPVASTVYAVEPVANLRRFLWEKREELGFDNVFPLDGTITQIPLPEDFADIVMSGHVFGDHPAAEYEEMVRVTRDGGLIILHPGTHAGQDQNKTHQYLLKQGFEFDTFEEPRDGTKRKYWKTIHK